MVWLSDTNPIPKSIHISHSCSLTRKTFRPVSMATAFEAHVSITSNCAPRIDIPLFKTNVVDSGESSKGFSKLLRSFLGCGVGLKFRFANRSVYSRIGPGQWASPLFWTMGGGLDYSIYHDTLLECMQRLRCLAKF
jgi:hypothetical protein